MSIQDEARRAAQSKRALKVYATPYIPDYDQFDLEQDADLLDRLAVFIADAVVRLNERRLMLDEADARAVRGREERDRLAADLDRKEQALLKIRVCDDAFARDIAERALASVLPEEGAKP